ncbi:holin family protein [Gelria sp. Kuro-4]|uniref:phage holin family protein n=1 Tax=Gelria sp. Kuro-4 TaxID=2796927 RepID=UPI001BEDF837|nr:phage holin family protein [Gelria sp. Kuro-4]BCV23307.1 holin [Gelria sp. Kuro-4]
MTLADFKAAVGVVGGVIVYYLGGWDIALYALLMVMVLDYLTGVSKAVYLGKLNSYIGFKGITKKVAYLFLVALAAQVDLITGATGAVRSIVIMFLFANEGLSIVENLAEMEVPIPDTIRNALEVLKAKDKNGGK